MRTGSAGASARRGRVLRAIAASTTATFAALVSHLAAGGALPPAPALLGVLVLSWPVAILLVGRRSGRVGLAAVIAASELGFHAAFTLLGTGGGDLAATGGMPGMPGMPGMSALPVGPGAALPAEPAMWAAHAAAAALTWALCLRGEAAVRTLLAVLQRLVPALAPLLAVVVPDAPAQPAPAAPARPRNAPLDPARPLRGPPLPARS